MNSETFLVTGAHGCIGAWIVRTLVQQEKSVIATDLADNPTRLRLLLSDEELERVQFRALDVTDTDAVKSVLEESGASRVIHLAGLQVPFCKANPVMGARVNVVGTINVLEAIRSCRDQVKGFSYASSIAVLGPPSRYREVPIDDSVERFPETLYGVYKVADEDAARIYWQDHGLGSVGLRPYIVYGVARDQGLTSDIAKAILAAVGGVPFRVNFCGLVSLQFARDVAEMFIRCAEADVQGAHACNLRNDVVEVEEFVRVVNETIPGAEITLDPSRPLPFPADTDDGGLRSVIGDVPFTPMKQAVVETAQQFRELLAEKKISLEQVQA